MSEQLSEHFTLEELTRTGTGLPNTPDAAALYNLRLLATGLLEPIRKLWGDRPIKINSGFRSQAVNVKIGGAKHSQHLKGEAADIVPFIPAEEAMKILYDAYKAGKLPTFGQIIIYSSGFLHVSIKGTRPGNEFLRSEARSGSGGPYRVYHP